MSPQDVEIIYVDPLAPAGGGGRGRFLIALTTSLAWALLLVWVVLGAAPLLNFLHRHRQPPSYGFYTVVMDPITDPLLRSQVSREAATLTVALALLFLIHALALGYFATTSQVARLVGCVFVPLGIASLSAAANGWSVQSALGGLLASLLVVYLLAAFSLPLNPWSMGILWLLYLNLALAMFLAPGSFYIMVIVYMAAFWFPKHRSLGAFWRPAPLPARRRMPRGVTLIELLIVVAIVSIMVAGLAHTTSVMSHAARRQAELRESVRLAEDQFALLRAGGALPAAGRHPVDASLRELYAVAALAEFEVRPGPDPRLREVRVIVHLSGVDASSDVEMAALLPAGAEGMSNEQPSVSNEQ